MVRLLLRVLAHAARRNRAFADGYTLGKQDGLEDGKRIAIRRVFDLSRNEYPGAARTIQSFIRSYFNSYL